MEEIHILDGELSKIINGYPKISDESFVATIRLYYILYSKQPQLGDFTSVVKDDPERTVYLYGPIINRAVKRKTAQDAAIVDFISTILKLPVDTGGIAPRIVEVGATRHVHFIAWNFWDKDHLLKMKRDFWRGHTTIPRSNFVFVGRRCKDDASVCTHVLSDVSTPDLEQRKEIELRKHVRICLQKEIQVEATGGLDPSSNINKEHPWRAMPKDFLRENIPIDVWRKEHPYFGHCVYTKNMILLAPEERARLLETQQKWYDAMEAGTIGQENIDEFGMFLSHRVARLVQLYANSGFDTFPFLLYQSFTLPEFLKIYVDPPTPRLPPGTNLPFSQTDQDSAAVISRMMYWLTNKKTGKGKQTLLVFDRKQPPIAQFLASFKHVPWRHAADSHCFIDDEKIASDFVCQLGAGWHYPYEALLPPEPLLCDKNHDLFSILPFSQNNNNNNSSSTNNNTLSFRRK